MIAINERQCSYCRKVKPVSEFGSSATSICLECRRKAKNQRVFDTWGCCPDEGIRLPIPASVEVRSEYWVLPIPCPLCGKALVVRKVCGEKTPPKGPFGLCAWCVNALLKFYGCLYTHQSDPHMAQSRFYGAAEHAERIKNHEIRISTTMHLQE